MHHLSVMSGKYFHSSSWQFSWTSLQPFHLVICADQLNRSEKYMLLLARNFKIMSCFLSAVAPGNVSDNNYSSASVIQSGFPRTKKKNSIEFEEELQYRGKERQSLNWWDFRLPLHTASSWLVAEIQFYTIILEEVLQTDANKQRKSQCALQSVIWQEHRSQL